MKTRWFGVLAIAAMTNACAEATEELPVCEFCGADSAASDDAQIDAAVDDTSTVDDTSVVAMDTGAADTAKSDATDAKSDATDARSDAIDSAVGADAMDSSTPDTLVADTGTVAADTGPFDVGSDTRDSAPLDTGPFDTGTVAQDTGPFDTGSATDTNTCAVDQTNSCGTCGRACSSTNVDVAACTTGECWSTCQTGYSNCARPAAPAPDDGCECEGTTCCGNSCATKHDNGVGQNWYDCVAAGTINQSQATAAANAWYSESRAPIECPSMGPAANRSLCILRVQGTECGLWCYTGPGTGRSQISPVSACACPTTTSGSSTWN